MLYLEKHDFERRLAVEKELDKMWEYKSKDNPNSVLPSISFEESDTFIIFGSLLGIKVINIHSNRLVRLIGKVENTERFLQLALYQGIPSRLAGQEGKTGTGGKTS